MNDNLTPAELPMLTSEEQIRYQILQVLAENEEFKVFCGAGMLFADSLILTRSCLKDAGEMMRKHEWVFIGDDDSDEAIAPILGNYHCLECRAGWDSENNVSIHVFSREDIRRIDGKHHNPDCAYAALLAKIEAMVGKG